jgi:hypothetical protein
MEIMVSQVTNRTKPRILVNKIKAGPPNKLEEASLNLLKIKTGPNFLSLSLTIKIST